jgi:hypothetical protein
MTWQMRNWYYFTWLSGDFNVEQHVHFLDVCSYFSVTYEYASGAKLFANCRQQAGCFNDISAHVQGTKGAAQISKKGLIIADETGTWTYDGKKNNSYQTEHDELFASIRNSRPINNGDYMSKSTLLAIMGRMAAYTGQEITWEMALNSQEDLTPPKYDWEVPLPVPPVARPGVTEFV